MKKIKLLTFLCVPLLVVGCGNTPRGPANPDNTIEVTMVSHFGEVLGEAEYKDNCTYEDAWFFEDNTRINYNLALASAMSAGASYSNSLDNNGQKINKFLTDTGFKNIKFNYYYSNGLKLQNSIGAVIGQKTIKDDSGKSYTLLAVFPRNAGYADEWYGNFNIDASGTHVGFILARDEVLRFLKNYITTSNVTGDLKIWTTGYSRGAAVINLVAGYLADSSGYLGNTVTLDSKDIYAYTIGTPRTTLSSISKSKFLSVSGVRDGDYHDTDVAAYTSSAEGTINPEDEKYNYIHNFTASGDYIAKLPLKEWGFTRFGKSEDVTYGSDKMISYLRELSTETADTFVGKNYESELPTTTIDFETAAIEETETLKSPDEVLEERISTLADLCTDLEETVNKGYVRILGDLVSAWGCDSASFISGLTGNLGETIKAALLTYFAHVAKTTEKSDVEAMTSVVMDIMDLLGKNVEDRENYTDEMFVKDIFDYVINDYQDDEDEKAQTRIRNIVALLPEVYGNFILGVLNYAKQNSLKVQYFDDLLLLIAKYINSHLTDKVVLDFVDTVAGLIPESAVGYLPFFTGNDYSDPVLYPDTKSKAIAGLTDIFDQAEHGRATGSLTADEYRLGLMNMLVGYLLMDYESPNIINMIGRGAKQLSEPIPPVKLSVVVGEVFNILCPKVKDTDTDTEIQPTLEEAANSALCALLEKGKSDANAVYIDDLIANIDLVKDVVFALLFNNNSTYNLAKDLENGLTFYNNIRFLIPAHFHEMYICYLKSCF